MHYAARTESATRQVAAFSARQETRSIVLAGDINDAGVITGHAVNTGGQLPGFGGTPIEDCGCTD